MSNCWKSHAAAQVFYNIMCHVSGLLGSNIKREWENLMIPEIESSSDQESVDDVWSINDEQREYYLKQFQNIEPDVNGQITGKSGYYLKLFQNIELDANGQNTGKPGYYLGRLPLLPGSNLGKNVSNYFVLVAP